MRKYIKKNISQATKLMMQDSRSLTKPDSEEEMDSLIISQEIYNSEHLIIGWKNNFETFSWMVIWFPFSLFLTYLFLLPGKNVLIEEASKNFLALFCLVALGIFIFAGIFFLYNFSVGIFNQTKFTIRNGKLKVSPSPLPWFILKKEFSTNDIEQIYVEEYGYNILETRTKLFRIVLVTNNGTEKIQSRLASYEDALTIEMWIEKKLGINDEIIEKECNWKKWYKIKRVV